MPARSGLFTPNSRVGQGPLLCAFDSNQPGSPRLATVSTRRAVEVLSITLARRGDVTHPLAMPTCLPIAVYPSKSSVKAFPLVRFLLVFAILIPLMMPIKIVIGPASYTLASHIPNDRNVYFTSNGHIGSTGLQFRLFFSGISYCHRILCINPLDFSYSGGFFNKTISKFYGH